MIKYTEYIQRRNKLLTMMVPKSAALIFSAPKFLRNANNDYPYRQNSDFWYFSGFNESEALLILIKYSENIYKTVLFNQSRDEKDDFLFSGRLGQNNAPYQLKIDQSLPWEDIEKKLHFFLKELDVVYHAQGEYDFADYILLKALNILRKYANSICKIPMHLIDWRPLVHNMRIFKSNEEIKIIRRSCEITTIAHTRAMKQCKVGMYEYQLEAEIQYEFNYHGARFPSYKTIIGSGENGCILHYTENNSIMLDNDLVLVDAGCEYLGYSSDVTRTFPINGKFLPAQRAVYEIVLDMLNFSLNKLIPGETLYNVNNQAIHIMVTGLVNIGVMKGDVEILIKEEQYKKFFMHNIGHWIGLDVHDVLKYGSPLGEKTPLEPGMVLSVEPGIYINSNINVPIDYRGIGIRIEDNILITENGNVNLTVSLVKDIDSIENLFIKNIN